MIARIIFRYYYMAFTVVLATQNRRDKIGKDFRRDWVS